MARRLAYLALCWSAGASEILLASFDGQAPHQWTQMNDPVMGGQSSGNFTVADGVGVLLGQVADVPYLKAPGFIQAYVTDVSPFEIFPDITGCKSLSLEVGQEGVKSMVDYKGYRFSFGSAHAPGGKFHAYGYKSNFDAGKVAEWNTVTLPIEGFTDFWDDATGEAIKTCQEIDFGTGESTTESTVSSEEVKGEAISSDHGSCHTASDTSGSVSVAPTSTMPTGKGKMERARAKLARRKKKDKKKSCKGQCVDTTTQCWLCQKKINEELIAGSQQSRAALEGVIERQLPRMNGVNLATAFHRFVRSGDRSHGHGDSGIFTTMLQHVQEQAEMEFQLGDGRMPSNCCTLIAWSCACYGQFDRESFVLLSRLAARDLSACQDDDRTFRVPEKSTEQQDYEVTNLLWAWSQLYKSQSPIISSLEGDLELFLDTLAAHVAVRGPGRTVGKEVIKSWEQLTVQGRQQAAAAFKFTRLRDRQSLG
eukprot:g27271.t1